MILIPVNSDLSSMNGLNIFGSMKMCIRNYILDHWKKSLLLFGLYEHRNSVIFRSYLTGQCS